VPHVLKHLVACRGEFDVLSVVFFVGVTNYVDLFSVMLKCCLIVRRVTNLGGSVSEGCVFISRRGRQYVGYSGIL
jgi:hypothetical protein